VWQFWRIFQIFRLVPILKKLCEEYEGARSGLSREALPAADEVYMACLTLIGFIARFTTPHYDYVYERRAKEVGEESLAILLEQEDSPISTALLIKARLASNPLTSKLYRDQHREEVGRVLARLSCLNYSADKMEEEIEQGYKTVCRLGRMMRDWKACRVALRHDKSKDLFRKTIIYPQYWFYLVKYTLGLAS
jgi:hypothetical protein